jgi:hypothetical protein
MGLVRKAAVCTLLTAFVLQTCAAADAASRKQRHAKARTPASPQRIVCGMTGCFDVPPGCRSEIRPTGDGVIAVVICDKK